VQGVTPDLATWGKAIGNGFSFCALTGKAEIMDLGGIQANKHPKVFLLSSTHGGEAHTLAAALAVVKEYRDRDVIGTHHRLVAQVAERMRQVRAAHRLEAHIDITVTPWRIATAYRDKEGQFSASFRTMMLQEMFGHGVLFQGLFLPCFTHSDADIAQLVEAWDRSCTAYSYALEQGVAAVLVGRPTRPVFRRYNSCPQSCPADPCPHETACTTGQ
jgi:glutamate-1-semialdehyde aminotransferase